jgi:hypothetical protein
MVVCKQQGNVDKRATALFWSLLRNETFILIMFVSSFSYASPAL